MPDRKNVVITGATSGIGRLAALKLSSRADLDLILVVRDIEKGRALRAEMVRSSPGSAVQIHRADFGRLDTVSEAARAIMASNDRVDVLINNAGQHAFTQRVTPDGFAEMISVNYLAPWLLTTVLRPSLVHSAPSRIVTVASEASRRVGSISPLRDLLDTAPFTRFGSSMVYARTKLMNVMFSLELSRRLEGSGVAVTCLDPGFNVTGLGRELPFAGLIARALRFLRLGDPWRGAEIIVRVTTDPEFGSKSGAYVSVIDAKPIEPASPADDAEARKALWAATARVLSDWGACPTEARGRSNDGASNQSEDSHDER